MNSPTQIRKRMALTFAVFLWIILILIWTFICALLIVALHTPDSWRTFLAFGLGFPGGIIAYRLSQIFYRRLVNSR